MGLVAFFESLLRLVEDPAWGYFFLFLLVALETALILHFVPAIGIVVAAAAFLAHGPWSLAAVIVVATAGATLGSYVLYLGSRYGGRGFIQRHPRWFGMTPQRLARLEATFAKPAGEVAVFTFRLVPILRALVTIPAGLAQMRVRRFLALTASGHLVLNSVLGFIAFRTARRCPGYARTRSVDALNGCTARLSASLTKYWLAPNHGIPLLLAALAIVALAWWAVRNRRRIVHEYDHVFVAAWERTAFVAIAAAVVMFLSVLLFPRIVTAFATWVGLRVFPAWHAEDNPIWYVILLAFECLAVGLPLLALRYVLADPVRQWRRRRRERRLLKP